MKRIEFLSTKERIDILLHAYDDSDKEEETEEVQLARRIMIDKLRMPLENNIIKTIIVDKFFIKLFLLYFYRDNEDVDKFTRDVYSDSNVAVRRFDSKRSMCFGLPLKFDDGFYAIWDGVPALVSFIGDRGFIDVVIASEVWWLFKPEIKTLLSLTISVSRSSEHRNAFVPLSDDMLLPKKFVLGKSEKMSQSSLERAKYAILLVERLNKLASIHKSDFNNQDEYQFNVDDQDLDRVKKVMKGFNYDDELLIRVSYLYLKTAILLKMGRGFAEDAAANLYHSIEGCLRLIHRDKIPGEFNFEETLSYLENNYYEDIGVREYLEEIRYNRNQVVHPDNVSKLSWVPNIGYDELIDHYWFGTELLYFVITGELLPGIDELPTIESFY